MRLGIAIPNHGRDAFTAIKELPLVAEECGFESLWLTDHLVGVAEYRSYGPFWAEALTSLAHIAARTSTIRLGVGVMVLPYRNPVYTTKVLTTIDHLSDGRLDVGVGVGWARAEFDALGCAGNFASRGPLSNESLELMLAAWKGGPLAWQSTSYSFADVTIQPPPVQRPHPRMFVGGHSGRALERAARFADIWHPVNISASEFSALGDRLDRLAGRRIPRSVRLRLQENEISQLAEKIASFNEAGCELAVIELQPSDRTTVQRNLERIGSHVPNYPDCKDIS